MQYIDAFNHFFPAAFFDKMLASPGAVADIGKRIRGIENIHNLESRRRQVDMFPGYSQILSLGLPALDAFADPETSPEFARIANDGLAEICAKYPEQFPGYVAGLPMNNPDAAVRAISFTPSDRKFVTCSDDKTVRVWDFWTLGMEAELRGHNADVYSVAWHPGKALLLSGSRDTSVKLWDPKTGQDVKTL